MSTLSKTGTLHRYSNGWTNRAVADVPQPEFDGIVLNTKKRERKKGETRNYDKKQEISKKNRLRFVSW